LSDEIAIRYVRKHRLLCGSQSLNRIARAGCSPSGITTRGVKQDIAPANDNHIPRDYREDDQKYGNDCNLDKDDP